MLGTEHYTYRPDGKIWFYKVGRGDPLVFLHNLGVSSFIWRKVQDKFAEHFTCYLVDLPGHGHSDIPPRQYSMSDYSKAVVDVLDSAGIKETSIVGSHGGCVVVVDLAVNYPHRVKKLVLDALPYWNKEGGRIVWEKSWMPGFTDKTSYDIPVEPLRIREEVNENPNLDQELEQVLASRNRRWFRLTYEALYNYNVEEAGPKIKAPLLMINGEHDHLLGRQHAVEAIKGSILKVLKQTSSFGGEGIHWGNSEEFTKLALDFLLDRR